MYFVICFSPAQRRRTSPDLGASYTVAINNVNVEEHIFRCDMQPITAEEVGWSMKIVLKTESLNAICSKTLSNLFRKSTGLCRTKTPLVDARIITAMMLFG